MTVRSLAAIFNSLAPRALWASLLLVAVCVVGTAAALATDPSGPAKYLTRLLDLTKEGTVGAWGSSLLLLFISISAFVAAMIERDAAGRRTLSAGCIGWMVLSLTFLALSWDEHASFHERLGSFEGLNVSGGRLTDWVGVFIVPLAAFLLFMVWFLWRRFGRDRVSMIMIVGGALLYASVPLQEEAETRMRWRGSESPETYERPVHLAVAEEATELAASLLLFAAFARFVRRRGRDEDGATDDAAIPWLLPPIPWVLAGGGWAVHSGWGWFATKNFAARESYVDPSYWLAAVAATGGAIVTWGWWRSARGDGDRVSAPWVVVLVVAATATGFDYGAGLTIRSLAGHALGGTVVAGAISVVWAALGWRWFTQASNSIERGSVVVWAAAVIGATWATGTTGTLLTTIGWASFVNAIFTREDWLANRSPALPSDADRY